MTYNETQVTYITWISLYQCFVVCGQYFIKLFQKFVKLGGGLE